ncbi:MAG TPA: cupin domain-containing protein [Nitrospiraceae bacterium]|nr:cupin domain-containing protein [Nitrospiraceae bacterium]
MTDEEAGRQERAALYALGALGSEEAKAFERQLADSAGLEREVDLFRGIADELAFAGNRITPPATLKDRLLARVAHEPQEGKDDDQFTFVRTATLEWQDIGDGVSVKLVYFDPAGARLTTLMKMGPGSRYAAHVHAQVEEIYVLEGSCICAGRLLQAGDYHRAEASSTHPDTVSEQGCLALIMTSSKNKPARRR